MTRLPTPRPEHTHAHAHAHAHKAHKATNRRIKHVAHAHAHLSTPSATATKKYALEKAIPEGFESLLSALNPETYVKASATSRPAALRMAAVAPGEDCSRRRGTEAEEPYGVLRALRDEKCVCQSRMPRQCLRLVPTICAEVAPSQTLSETRPRTLRT